MSGPLPLGVLDRPPALVVFRRAVYSSAYGDDIKTLGDSAVVVALAGDDIAWVRLPDGTYQRLVGTPPPCPHCNPVGGEDS